MKFDVVTIFPAMFERPLAEGVLGRAVSRGTLDVTVHDLRDFTTDRHRVVDDVPYGGGPGMVLKPDPIFRALDAIEAEHGSPAAVILTSPQGKRFTQAEAQRLSRLPHIVLLCGRYEGVDERVRERVTEEVSIGDYVLSGGELPALVIIDAVSRHVPGVVGDEQSVAEDSFSRGLLDFPQYTRPAALAVRRTGSANRDVRRRDVDGARGAAIGQPRGDPTLAEAAGNQPDAGTAARLVGRRGLGRGRAAHTSRIAGRRASWARLSS